MTICNNYRHEFAMPEHVLLALTEQDEFVEALEYFREGAVRQLRTAVKHYLSHQESVPAGVEYEMALSAQFNQLMELAYNQVINSSAPRLDVPHIVQAMLSLEDSNAR